MKLPKNDSSPFRRYLYGRHVARRLSRAGHADLLARVDAVDASLLLARVASEEDVPTELFERPVPAGHDDIAPAVLLD